MTQGDLFDDVCRRKHGNNPYSTAAAVSSDRADQRRKVLQAITATGEAGMTYAEACKALEKPPNSISPRFSELARDGKIRHNGQSRKTDSGCAARVFVAVRESPLERPMGV